MEMGGLRAQPYHLIERLPNECSPLLTREANVRVGLLGHPLLRCPHLTAHVGHPCSALRLLSANGNLLLAEPDLFIGQASFHGIQAQPASLIQNGLTFPNFRGGAQSQVTRLHVNSSDVIYTRRLLLEFSALLGEC
jgi:hypothetical protein